jgi:hypothetical protein
MGERRGSNHRKLRIRYKAKEKFAAGEFGHLEGPVRPFVIES